VDGFIDRLLDPVFVSIHHHQHLPLAARLPNRLTRACHRSRVVRARHSAPRSPPAAAMMLSYGAFGRGARACPSPYTSRRCAGRNGASNSRALSCRGRSRSTDTHVLRECRQHGRLIAAAGCRSRARAPRCWLRRAFAPASSSFDHAGPRPTVSRSSWPWSDRQAGVFVGLRDERGIDEPMGGGTCAIAASTRSSAPRRYHAARAAMRLRTSAESRAEAARRLPPCRRPRCALPATGRLRAQHRNAARLRMRMRMPPPRRGAAGTCGRAAPARSWSGPVWPGPAHSRQSPSVLCSVKFDLQRREPTPGRFGRCMEVGAPGRLRVHRPPGPIQYNRVAARAGLADQRFTRMAAAQAR